MVDVANVCESGLCVCGNVKDTDNTPIPCSGSTPFCGKSNDVGVKADSGDEMGAECQVH